MTMDCQHARETLDAARPDRSDWDAPELRSAVEHLDRCDECQEVVEYRRQFDRRIEVAMREVTVPAGLQERLLAAVASEGAVQPASGPTDVRPTRRARWMWTLASAATILIAVAGWFLRGPTAVSIPLDQLFVQLEAALPNDAADSDATAPDLFDQRFDATPGDPAWQEAIAGTEPRGIDLDGVAGDDAALYSFRERRVSGWLVVLPRDRVASPPNATQPSHAFQRYGPRPQVAWSSGDHVYVCVLERGTVDDLLRQFYGVAA